MANKGTAREHQVIKQQRAEGWIVYRAAGSMGCADFVALRRGYVPHLVQVKATAGGPYERFGPAERRLLVEEAHEAGARPALCWWPPNKPQLWIPPSEWPS